jgi:hypothetical protein
MLNVGKGLETCCGPCADPPSATSGLSTKSCARQEHYAPVMEFPFSKLALTGNKGLTVSSECQRKGTEICVF